MGYGRKLNVCVLFSYTMMQGYGFGSLKTWQVKTSHFSKWMPGRGAKPVISETFGKEAWWKGPYLLVKLIEHIKKYVQLHSSVQNQLKCFYQKKNITKDAQNSERYHWFFQQLQYRICGHSSLLQWFVLTLSLCFLLCFVVKMCLMIFSYGSP